MGDGSAEDFHARLAVRSLLAPVMAAGAGEPPEPGPCMLRTAARKEFDDVLRSSLSRRLARLQRAVAVLSDAACGAATAPAPAAAPPPPLSGAQRPAQRVETKELVQAAAKALRAASVAAKQPKKAYGPTAKQLGLPKPPEKEEEILAESHVLKNTLETLLTNCAARRRQITSLREQHRRLDEVRREHSQLAAASAERERALLADPASVAKEHERMLCASRQDVAALKALVERKSAEAKKYRELMRQQRRYFIQCERMAMLGGGRDLVKFHPAGDVAIVLAPLPITEDEKVESYDIGTAVVNPYVVDSWPFEPNVLASRREITQPPMQPFQEESTRDLQDEQMRLPRRCTGLPLRDDESERDWEDAGDDDDDGRPMGSTRSM